MVDGQYTASDRHDIMYTLLRDFLLSGRRTSKRNDVLPNVLWPSSPLKRCKRRPHLPL